MSVATMCIGDRVRRVTLSGGQFGNEPSFVEGDPVECRIDINSGSESNSEGVANETRTGTIFFAKNPKLRAGHYLRWLTRGCEAIDPSVLFRVTTIDNGEGRPGETPWLWSVEVTEDNQASKLIRDEMVSG
jgi:hypothetical protein